jgi:hypothetical protein
VHHEVKGAVMSANTVSTDSWVELADRSGDGLDVRLLWNRSDGRVKVTVTRVAADSVAELDVAPEDALTAFHHPFAYRRPAVERPRAAVADAMA